MLTSGDTNASAVGIARPQLQGSCGRDSWTDRMEPRRAPPSPLLLYRAEWERQVDLTGCTGIHGGLLGRGGRGGLRQTPSGGLLSAENSRCSGAHRVRPLLSADCVIQADYLPLRGRRGERRSVSRAGEPALSDRGRLGIRPARGALSRDPAQARRLGRDAGPHLPQGPEQDSGPGQAAPPTW
jgi:hypothetical protein